MDFMEFRAKTLSEAITKACLAFSVTSSDLEYKVLQEASSGFLGLGARPCVITARPKALEEPAAPEKKTETAKKAAKKSAPAKEEQKKGNDAQTPPAPSMPKAENAESAANKAADPEPVAEEEKPAKENPRYVSMDEIELRAARAAARAKESGEEPRENTRPEREERFERGRRDRFDSRNGERGGRDRRQKGYDRRDRGGRDGDRYGRRGRYDRPGIGVFVEEKPHEPSVPKPERVVTPRTEEEVAKLVSAAESFLKDVFGAMQCAVDMTSSYDQANGCLEINFSGEDMGILIGKRGQTLDSLQYLTSLIVNRETEEYVRVKLDTEDYRARRADTLENLSRNVAYKVKQSGKAIALEPMNPYERRIIHSTLQHNRFVETYSEGEEPFRHVVVAPRRP